MIKLQLEDYLKIRQDWVWMDLPQLTCLQITGEDAGSFLQTQTTQDILKIKPGFALPNALVDRKAHLKALFLTLHPGLNDYLLLGDSAEMVRVAEHLEAYHFVESLEILPRQDLGGVLVLGPNAYEVVQKMVGERIVFDTPLIQIQDLIILLTPYWGELGLLILGASQKIKDFQAQLSALPLAPELRECLRIEAGLPAWGQELFPETKLPETGRELETVSYDKGCYLGQETIARIKAYGVIPKALVGLKYSGDAPEAGLPIFLEYKEIGLSCSRTYSWALQAEMGLAYLHKNHRNFGSQLTLTIGDKTYQAEVMRLPIQAPNTPQVLAQALYEEALGVFAGTDENAAIDLLEKALAIYPALPDAYECLGVILARQNKIPEAIAVMQKLLQWAPEEPMAHTNLSRFFMLQGDKETAEQHMAEAGRLNMARSLKQKSAEAEQKKAQAQKAEMIAMFKEVLETEDPEDLVANYGLGKIYFDLEQYTAAQPLLKKAIEIEPLYSSAYLYLGKTLEALGELSQAQAIYTQGVQVAHTKGDLMPLKEMETKLLGLKIQA